jgi:protease I
MATDLTGVTVAFLTATEGVEQVEFTEPWDALKNAGATVHLVTPDGEKMQAFNHLDKADTFSADRAVADANPGNYDALVLPGGVANPDNLRTDEQAVAFAKAFLGDGKVVAAICHAPWTLVEAGVVEGRTLTSWPSLQTDLRNAGATWVDEEVVVDADGGPGTLVTSRNPDDLPAFCAKVIELLGALEITADRA